MSPFTVRVAGPADRGAIEAVTLAAYLEYAEAIPAHWDSYRQNIVATLAAAPPGTQIVALEGDRMVGAVLLCPAGTAIEIGGAAAPPLAFPEVRLLAVAPSARGRGIGEALMKECIERARSASAPALTLHTTDFMEAAMRLYGRLGFARAEDLDFRPVPGIVVKGFRLDLSTAPASRETRRGRSPLRLQDFYPIIVTDKLVECREFYVRFFGLSVGFEASWIVYMTAGDGGRASLAFMHPDHPSAPPGPERFSGKGMCLEFQVEDAAAEHERFREDGAPVSYPLRDEPFGQRRFGLFDPAGVWIDVVEQIEPEPEFWERYPPAP